METEIMVATALSGGSLILLGLLTYVWAQNYRQFRSPLVLGLLAFSVVLAIENAVAIYFFFTPGMFYAGNLPAQQSAVILRGLQFIALCFLSYVTIK